MVGDPMTATQILNVNSVYHMNKAPLLNVGENLPVFTEKAHYFGMVVHKVDNNHSGRKDIFVRYWDISLKYVSINNSSKR